MTFSVPPGFDFITPRTNDRVGYSCAIGVQDPKLELRYHIFPLKLPPLPPGYTSVASADLNTLHVPNMLAMIQNVARAVLVEPNLLPADGVKAEFGADWGAVCRLALAPSAFADGFAECLLLALHRKDVADAYVFFMFQDFQNAASLINSNFYTLRFRQRVGVCPNCEAIIAMDAPECPKCGAQFGPEAAWKIQPIEG